MTNPNIDKLISGSGYIIGCDNCNKLHLGGLSSLEDDEDLGTPESIDRAFESASRRFGAETVNERMHRVKTRIMDVISSGKEMANTTASF